MGETTLEAPSFRRESIHVVRKDMRNLFCFFVVCFFSCNWFLESHEESKKGSIEELLSSCSESIEIKNGEIGLNPERTWSFNDQIYILNDSEQWMLASNKILNSVDEYIQDHANRGICFKGHRGEYLDRSFYPKGVWCCRGFYNGEKCPYHIDRQFPNGIPRGDRLTCLPNDKTGITEERTPVSGAIFLRKVTEEASNPVSSLFIRP
jgi:hypothetical protein